MVGLRLKQPTGKKLGQLLQPICIPAHRTALALLLGLPLHQGAHALRHRRHTRLQLRAQRGLRLCARPLGGVHALGALPLQRMALLQVLVGWCEGPLMFGC